MVYPIQDLVTHTNPITIKQPKQWEKSWQKHCSIIAAAKMHASL